MKVIYLVSSRTDASHRAATYLGLIVLGVAPGGDPRDRIQSYSAEIEKRRASGQLGIFPARLRNKKDGGNGKGREPPTLLYELT